jgi:hypothetical protein
LPYRDLRSLRSFDSGQNPIGGGFDFDDCFVSFYFKKGLTFRDMFSLFLPPSDELAGFLRHLESGHYYAEGHSRSVGEGLDDGLQP